jgi:DNA modification methylase
MVDVFMEVKRVLRDDGTLWLNLGDSYGARGGDTHTGFNERYAGNGIDGKQTKTKDNFAKSEIKTGLKPKDLCGIPWRVAFALQADGWWLRSEITWCKKSAMPESVTDRPTKATEKIFLLSKSANYFFDQEAVREKSGANMRDYWVLGPEPFSDAHFATFVSEIPKRCILAGTSAKGCCAKCGSPWERVVEKTKTFESGSGRAGNLPNGKQDLRASETNSTPDVRLGPVVSTQTLGWQATCECEVDTVPCTVLDPFSGSGTTGAVALELGRSAILIELNPKYAELINQRCCVTTGLALA